MSKYILYQIKSEVEHANRFILVNDLGEEWRYYRKAIIKYNGNYKKGSLCIKAIQHYLSK